MSSLERTMKPIACSNSSQSKPLLPPAHLHHPIPSNSPTPRDLATPPVRDSPSPTDLDDSRQVTVPRRQNKDRRVKVKASKCLANGTDRRTKTLGTDDCSDLDEALIDRVYPLVVKRSSGMPPNVDFSILRETGSNRKQVPGQQSNDDDTVTSSSENSPHGGVADVIYDKPFAEFELKSLQRIIKSDGYVKLGTDVVEATESLRKAALKYRKYSFRGPGDKTTASNTAGLPKNGLRHRWSTESVDQLDVLLDFSGCSSNIFTAGKPLRSSFVDPNGPPTRRSVYLELGEYQTLLKHSRNDDERVYSLPQSQCYGEDTLRAVKLITEKYDTFKRRQLRALSFRDEGCVSRRPQHEGDEGKTPTDGKSPLSPVGPNAMGCAGDERTAQIHAESDASSVDRTPEAACAHPEVESSSKVSAEKTSRQPRCLSLRDYCNTLETDADTREVYGGGLSKSNLMRIELFYRSRESRVYVARCLADLFVGTLLGDDSCPMVHQHTGVPVWVLNTGLGIRSRELLLVLAERETGFPLWQDRINYLSNYHAAPTTPGVHCVRVSGSLRKMVELHMFCERSGEEFLERFHEIASNPQDDLWKVSTEDRKWRKTGRRKRRLRLSKSSISQPCNFVHISCVDPSDPNFRAAFSGLVPVPIGKSASDFSTASDTIEHSEAFDRVDDGLDLEFRPRFPTR